MKKMNNKGFSLVELIVVIAIMAVLVGVLAPQFIKFVEQSRQSTDMQNLQQLKTAIEVYAASDEGFTGATITVTGGASGKIVAPASAVSGSGLASETKLKSKTWAAGDHAYTYTTSYSWTSVACQNSSAVNGTNNDLQSIFE